MWSQLVRSFRFRFIYLADAECVDTLAGRFFDIHPNLDQALTASPIIRINHIL